MSHHFIDKENVTIPFQGEMINSKYTVEKQDDLIMTITNAKSISKFVIIPGGDDAFLMYLVKDYERMQQAGKAAPDIITWGWTKPAGIEFKRQVVK